MAFLQAAFESFKNQSNAENQKALRDLRAELEKSHEESMQRQIQDLGTTTNLFGYNIPFVLSIRTGCF